MENVFNKSSYPIVCHSLPLNLSLRLSLSLILTLRVSWSVSRSLRLSPSQTAPPSVRQALSHIERQLGLPSTADPDMFALLQGRSSLLHLLQWQAHELLQQVPQNGCVHAHLHNALHAATHQLVLKLLQDDGAHGVVVLRQQMVIHTTCMPGTTASR